MGCERRRALVLFLVAAAMSAGAGEDLELRIGPRRPAGPQEISPAEFQAVIRQLAPPAPRQPPARPDAAMPWEKSAEAAALAGQVRETPELFTRLLIPPGYPRAVSGAAKEVRVRAAAVLGLSCDLRVLQSLVDSSVYDPEDSVRLAAAKALKALDEPVAMRKLVDLATAGDRQKYPWPVRRSACVALRRYGDVAAVERLLRELSYELAGGNPLDPKNRTRAIASGLGTENPLAIPDGPPNLQLSEQDLYPVLSAVKEVTGMSFTWGEKEAKTWLQWWRKEGPKFAFKD